MTKPTAFGGLFNRKERWGLSLRGWIVFLLTAAALALALFFGIHPFLSINKPVHADYLIIEGWIPEFAVNHAAKIFKEQGYKKIFTVGGPVGGEGSQAAYDDTYAYVAAVHLKKLGLDPASYEMIPNQVRTRDRTFGSAQALRRAFEEKNLAPKSLDVATLGVHARRSRLLFQKAFGNETQIGIISLPNTDYDGAHWWRYSEGIKEVISEAGAYVYARLLFRPESAASTTP